MAPPPSVLIPWSFVGKLIFATGVPVMAVALIFGSGASGAMALAGLMPVMGAKAMARGPLVAAAPAALLAAIGLLALLPSVGLAWAIAFALALAGGWEAAKTGGRAFVFALYGWVAITMIPSMAPPAQALPFALAGMALGWGVARFLSLAGQFTLPASSPAFGACLAAFLCVGLALSAAVAFGTAHPYGYWVVLLFVFRAVVPHSDARARLGRYALGSVLGSLAALLMVLFGIDPVLSLLLALGLGAVALRYTAHPSPISAAASTAAVLLILPVGAGDILFRAEAVLSAVAIAGGLFLILSYGWRLVERAGAPAAE